MKILILSILLMSIITLTVFAEDFWEPTNGPNVAEVSKVLTLPDGEIYCAVYACGIFYSSDFGESWQNIGKGLPSLHISSLEMDSKGVIYTFGEFPGKKGIYKYSKETKNWIEFSNYRFCKKLFIDKDDNFYIGTDNAGLLFSSDNGADWISLGLESSPIRDIFMTVKNTLLVGTTSTGLQKSTDKGNSWKRVQNGLPDSIGTIDKIYYFDSETILINSGSNGLYKSTDEGDSWTPFVDNEINQNLQFAVKAKNGNYVGLTLNEVFISNDSGKTWSRQDSWEKGNICCDISINSDGSIIIGALDGIFISYDNGLEWVKKDKGFNVGFPRQFKCDTKGKLYAIHEAFGIATSTDKGQTWIQEHNSIYSDILFESSENIILCPREGTMKKSFDYGKTWGELSSYYFSKIYRVFVASNEDMYCGTSGLGLYKSTDKGENWIDLNDDLISYVVIDFCQDESDKIYVAFLEDGILSSTDNGSSWQQTSDGLPECEVWTLLSNKGKIFAGTDSGLYVSSDKGNSWDLLGSDSASTSSLRINSDGHIYASKRTGIFRTKDNGITWENVSSGLYDAYYAGPVCFDNEGYAYCATFGQGVYKSREIVSGINENSTDDNHELFIENFYPNPFNETNTIIWQSSVSGYTTLDVTDLFGCKVKNLIDEYKQPGRFEIQFDSSELPAGTYFYHLKVGNHLLIKKLLIMK